MKSAKDIPYDFKLKLHTLQICIEATCHATMPPDIPPNHPILYRKMLKIL